MFDDHRDVIVEFDGLQLCCHVVFMFLKLTYHFFYKVLVLTHEEVEAFLETSYVVSGVYQLVETQIIGFLPLILRRCLQFLVDKGLVDAASHDFLQKGVDKGEVLEKVLIYFGQVLQLGVHIAHQKINVKIMLAPQVLDQFVRALIPKVLGFEFVQPQEMIFLGKLPVLSGSGIFPDTDIASDDAPEGLKT